MSDQSTQKDCGCGSASQVSTSNQTAVQQVTKLVRAQVPQDYSTNLKVRLVPARSLDKAVHAEPRCKPRGNVTPWDQASLTLDAKLADSLSKADKVMVAWLARDTANAQSFLTNPLAAMRKAGVQLTRAEEKALARASEAAAAGRVVGPGINVASLSAQAYPKGRVGSISASKTEDFSCGPKRKG